MESITGAEEKEIFPPQHGFSGPSEDRVMFIERRPWAYGGVFAYTFVRVYRVLRPSYGSLYWWMLWLMRSGSRAIYMTSSGVSYSVMKASVEMK